MDHNTSGTSAVLPVKAPAPTPTNISQNVLLLAVGGLLQTIGETLALGSASQIPPAKALLICSTCAGGTYLLWQSLWQPAAQHFSLPWHTQNGGRNNPSRLLRQMTKNALLVLLLLAVLWSSATNGALLLQHPLDPSIYDSDAAAFVHYQAEDVLHGINPYTDTTGFWQAIAQFPNAGATPLQRGQFANQSFSPPDQVITSLLQRYLRNPAQAGPEFDPASLHSYPAGAFLLAVPFIWAGLPSTQPLYALCLLLLFGLLIWWTPKGHRWLTALVLISFSLAITLTLRSSFEVVCILCIVAAWRLQARRAVSSALLLGLGCAVKQLAWLFVPFYLLWVIKSSGWRQSARSGALALLVFSLINAPFIIAAPTAWAQSMLLPITEPAFPGGVGLITLAQGNILPLLPSWAFTALEMSAYLFLLAWYSARLRSGKPSDTPGLAAGSLGLFLALLLLLLASRSLISYTMFLPVLALAALLQQQDARTTPTQTPDQKAALP